MQEKHKFLVMSKKLDNQERGIFRHGFVAEVEQGGAKPRKTRAGATRLWAPENAQNARLALLSPLFDKPPAPPPCPLPRAPRGVGRGSKPADAGAPASAPLFPPDVAGGNAPP